MNLQISGHHLEITPALHDYVTSKLERVKRHFDYVIDVNVILSVEKLKQKAEVTVHLPGCVQRIKSAGAITAGAQVQCGALGTVAAGDTAPIGIALTAAAAADQLVEVLDRAV